MKTKGWSRATLLLGRREEKNGRLSGGDTGSLLDKQITRVLEKVAWHSLTHGCLLIAAYRKKGWRQRGDAKVKGEQRGPHFESSKRQGAEVEAKASIKTAYPAPLLSRPSLHRFVSAVGVAALRPIHSRHPTFRFALENPPFIILAFVTSDFRADRSKYFYPIVRAVRRGAIRERNEGNGVRMASTLPSRSKKSS